MRALSLCALLLGLSGASEAARGGPPPSIAAEASCEEECEQQSRASREACDDKPLSDPDRRFCHQLVAARLDVCLRICDE